MVAFGWWIEAGDMRWFTRDESRVRPFRDRKDAKVTKLVAVESTEEVLVPYCQVDEPECDHEFDVMKRCIKCGEDLSLTGRLMKGH